MRAAAASAPGGFRVSQSSSMSDILNYSGVEAAKWSPNRGWVDYAPLDTSKVATGSTRTTLLKLARWLTLNDGHARGIVYGLSNLVGYFTIEPATKDKKWNELAEKHWDNRTKTPAVFDRVRKFNHARWQLALSRGAMRDGDILTALTYSDSGAGQILLYNGHQIADPDGKEVAGRRDGVYHDPFYAHTGYNLISGDGKTSGTIKASDALYYGDFSDSGELRPPPRLTHAMNDLRDIAEIDLDSKLGIKRAQFVGLYRKKSKATSYGPQGFFQAPQTLSTGTQTNDDATTQETLVSVENVTDKPGVVTLDEGEDFGVVQSDQPGPNTEAFTKRILSKIALGLGLPPSVVFAMLGAGGPEVRFHMAFLQRWIQIELLNLLPIVQAHYFWMMGTDMARGVLPFPDDEEWWNHIAIPTADLTIDRGRELSGKIAALKVGALTHADIYAERGQDWEDQMELQAEIIAKASAAAAAKGLAGGLSDLMPDWNPRQMQQAPVDDAEEEEETAPPQNISFNVPRGSMKIVRDSNGQITGIIEQ